MRKEFEIEGEPPRATAQQKGVIVRGGRPIFYTKKSVKDDQARIMPALRKHCPALPIAGPVSLELAFVFSFKARTSLREREQGVIPMTERPDVDNLSKGVIDAMTKCGWWLDDSQITSLTVVKVRGASPRLCVSVEGEDG